MSSNKGRALVTGGAGLIGSHLVDLLLKEGYEVTALDILDPQTHAKGKPGWVNPEAQFIQGDVRKAEDLSRALKGVRFVFHLGAFVGFTSDVSKYIDVNAIGTARIFETLSTGKFSVEKVVVASSQAVYGEGAYQCERHGKVFPSPRSFGQLQKKQWELFCPQCQGVLAPVLTPEEKPLGSETPYALSKEVEEKLSLMCGRQRDLPVVALRYGVTYGPRQSLFNPYTGVASIFSTRILNNLPPLVYEDGKQTRDFIYVGDIARANLFVMQNKQADFRVFNVGTGKATTVAELARQLSSIYGKSIEPEMPGQFRVGDVRHIILDTSKLNSLGFRTSVPLKEGLTLFAEWLMTQGQVEEYFTEAYKNLKKNRVIHGSE